MAQTEKFCIAREGKTATIILDVDDWKGVIRAARDLGDDIRKVTGVAAQVELQSPNSAGLLPHERKNLSTSILVGTIGNSSIIDRLVKQKKIDVRQVRGQWEGRSFEPIAGDIIFFDWQNDGLPDHVGIVEKCDGGLVYTVEGNSADRCAQCRYYVGSSSIFGYGTPTY